MPDADLRLSAERKALLASLRSATPTRLMELPTSSLAEAAREDPEAFAVSLRGIARRCTPGVEAKRHDPEPILEFLDCLADAVDDIHVDHLRATADLYGVLDPERIAVARREHQPDDLLSAVESGRIANPRRHERPGALLAGHAVLGKIHSLADRGLAAEHFAELRTGDAAAVISRFYADLGALTYFSDTEVRTDSAAQDAQELRGAARVVGGSSPTSRTALVISVDPRFFRIYAPYLYFCAQQLPELDLCLLLCGSGAEAKELITDGRRYLAGLDALNHSGIPRNIRHFVMPVPSLAAERRTFYAAARFFAATELLGDYENLYLMDADLAVDAHPGAFLKKVASLPVAVPMSSGPAALSPWRRYMAGNIPLSRSVLETGFLEDLQLYLAHGLRHRDSWMLDQNALSYAVERFPGAVEDVNDYPRPIRTMRFMSTWESNHRKVSASRAGIN